MASSQGTWTFSLNDTDPVFRYLPYADGQLVNGWETGFTGVGLSPPDQDHNDGSGQSFHITAFPSLLFQSLLQLELLSGIGVSLLGQANCSYDVVLDGSIVSTSVALPSGTLYTGSNLDNTIHNITLVPHPTSTDQTLNFTGAQLVALASSSPIAERIDNQNTSVVSYSGSWAVHNAHQIPSPENPAPYFQTNKSGSSASLNFTGRAVAVRGESNFGWWTYSADLDGNSYIMNASSTFIIPDALLFYQDGLDEDVTHTLTLTNIADDGMFFALNSITSYRSTSDIGVPQSSASSTATEPESSSSDSASIPGLSGSAIAGIVVGTVLAISGFVGIALLFLRRRRRRKEILVSCDTIQPFRPPSMSEVTFVGPLPSRKGNAIQRTELQNANTSGQALAINHRKIQATPNESIRTTGTHISSSVDPPSSPAVRQSEQPDVNRLADAVVERLAMRFGSGSLNEDAPPPTYPG